MIECMPSTPRSEYIAGRGTDDDLSPPLLFLPPGVVLVLLSLLLLDDEGLRLTGSHLGYICPPPVPFTFPRKVIVQALDHNRRHPYIPDASRDTSFRILRQFLPFPPPFFFFERWIWL